MIWVSRVTARFELPDGLRLPRSRLRPSPKPMAAEGAPTARMREQTTAALAEGRKDFMIYETRGAQWSCALHGLCQAVDLPLARLFARIHRYRNAQVERGADDPGLLHGVRGRVALARRGALGPPDVAELDVGGQDLQQARGHVRAGAHVARLLLHPHDLAQVRVAPYLFHDLRLREGVEQLDAGD